VDILKFLKITPLSQHFLYKSKIKIMEESNESFGMDLFSEWTKWRR